MGEKYNLYAETDPNSHISPGESSVTLAGLARNEDAYLHRDFGVDAWNGDFTVDFVFNVSTSDSGSICGPVFLANAIDDIAGTHTDYIQARLYPYDTPSWNVGVYLVEKYSGTVYQVFNTNTGLAIGTTYYARVKRVGTAATYVVYASSANRSAETSPLVTLSLTLHGTVAFRYFYPVNNWNSGHTLAFNGTLSNHDIVVGPSNIKAVTDTGTGADSVLKSYVTVAVTDTGAGTENIVINDGSVRITVTDTGTGADSVLKSYVTVAVTDTGSGADSFLIHRTLTVTDSGAGVEVVGAVPNNSLAFFVGTFPSGYAGTMEWSIIDLNNVVVQDWTTAGVLEKVVIAGKSAYWIKGIMLENGFQGIILWRLPGTRHHAFEGINYYQSWISTYASLPTLSEIEGSSVLAKEATLAEVLTIVTLLKKYARNKRIIWKDPATGIKYLIIYDDNGTTELVRKALKDPTAANIADLAVGSLATEEASSV